MQAVCKAWPGDSLGNRVHFHSNVYYIPLQIMMERISRAEEAAQYFHGLLQHVSSLILTAVIQKILFPKSSSLSELESYSQIDGGCSFSEAA